MERRTRLVLNSIENVLLRGDQTSKELATILSALRGPDDQDDNLKVRSTGVVRAKAFPRLLKKYEETHTNPVVLINQYSWSFIHDPLPYGEELKGNVGSSAHFIAHAQFALDVLNSE